MITLPTKDSGSSSEETSNPDFPPSSPSHTDSGSQTKDSDSTPPEDSTPPDSEATCSDCTGILSVSSDTVGLKADGSDTSTSEITLSGWTTGLQVRCSADLAHVTTEISDTDTRETGLATVTFGLSGAFAGTEEGYCVVSSDYGDMHSILVKASPCPECSGVVECDDTELMIYTASYSSAHSTSTTCRGTATGIEVSCEGGDHFAFYYEVSAHDTTDTGKFTLSIGVSDGAYAYEHGTCTITDEQGSSIELCWWENDGRVTDPC